MRLTPTEDGFLDEDTGELVAVEGSLRDYAAARFLESRLAAEHKQAWQTVLLEMLDGDTLRLGDVALKQRTRRIWATDSKLFADALPELTEREFREVIAAARAGYLRDELPPIARDALSAAISEGVSAPWIEVIDTRNRR